MRATASSIVTPLAMLLATLVAAGCAQTAEEQIAPRSDTVRLCSGSECADVPRNTATFQGDPGDPEAERRLQALAEIAERDPRAAYDLGLRLLRGDGVTRDSYQAIEWLRKAGDRGHTEAQYALGRLYLLGLEEMGSDPAEAEAWLSRAAAMNYKDAHKLMAEAQAAKQEERELYRIRDEQRKSWGAWYSYYPYYWIWGPSGWYLR
ncbi:tetratricopeptide repeat protein [Thauera sp. Sel9]|uniref:tetratricopeptide repeat protein n=1 Tax=Thauera sp. Sel9 TaxID=2974299 RepID=UPI0021E1AC39|nr:tetratricopeptide repeat protein [Thauera sp. Sel9]MCV2219415.1 sel1 repeat family protein [Thauera sp. Sel9]